MLSFVPWIVKPIDDTTRVLYYPHLYDIVTFHGIFRTIFHDCTDRMHEILNVVVSPDDVIFSNPSPVPSHPLPLKREPNFCGPFFMTSRDFPWFLLFREAVG